jgi:hypothetical protein
MLSSDNASNMHHAPVASRVIFILNLVREHYVIGFLYNSKSDFPCVHCLFAFSTTHCVLCSF